MSISSKVSQGAGASPAAQDLAGAHVPQDEWEPTRALSSLATQIMHETGDEVAETRDVGRLTGNNQRELFVSCGPAEAMRQQFEILSPVFIAVHDIGTAVSRKLLVAIAGASGRHLQKLVIRRQGYGTTLATLEFVEWPTAQGARLRLYTTEIDADPASRNALAITLLANSRLGVVIVGDLALPAMTAALEPLQQGIVNGPWPNRHLLLLPLTAARVLAGQGAMLAGRTGVTVRTTPQVMRPAEAWSFISGMWNHIHKDPATMGLRLPGLASAADPPKASAAPAIAPAAVTGAPATNPVASARAATGTPAAAAAPSTNPLPLRPMPLVPGSDTAPMKLEDSLAEYVVRLFKLGGIACCGVFDGTTTKSLAHAGADFNAGNLAQQSRALMDAVVQSARLIGLPGSNPELALTLDAHHLVLRPLPHNPHLVLYAVFDRKVANLTLVRLQIQRLDEDLYGLTPSAPGRR